MRLAVDPVLLARLALAVGRQSERLGEVESVLAGGVVATGEAQLDPAVTRVVEALRAQASWLRVALADLADDVALACLAYAAGDGQRVTPGVTPQVTPGATPGATPGGHLG